MSEAQSSKSIVSPMVQIAEKQNVTVFDDMLKIYFCNSANETVRSWKLPQYPKNQFTLKCRNTGVNCSVYYNLLIVGPPISELDVKISKTNVRARSMDLTGEEVVFQRTINGERMIDWRFDSFDSLLENNDKKLPIVFHWIKVEFSIPKSHQLAAKAKIGSLEGIGNLFGVQDLSDFKVEANGKDFHVSKLVLAHSSPVFKSMFVSKLANTKLNSMQILDSSADIVELMLKFIYDNQIALDVDIDSIEQLLVLARKYEVKNLKERCEAVLLKSVDMNSASRLVKISELHNLPYLQQACIESISANYEAFLELEALELMDERIKIAVQNARFGG